MFPLENHWFNIKWVTRDTAENHVSWFEPLQTVWSQNKEGTYSRHSILYFPLLLAVASVYPYSSMRDKYPTLYVSSSCLSATLKNTNTNE